jgi:phage replication-related protein YjqB (UPF0714/DUF867 family)
MKPDRYASFAELSAAEPDGFQVRCHRRPSAIAVIAPHGGKIEENTSVIAEAIADEQFSFYAFEGIKPGRNWTLHITSTRFDEPECLELLSRSRIVAAVHGLDARNGEFVCLGGEHAELKLRLVEALRTAGFDARADDDPAHAGASPRNICNRFGPGVQLEISRPLRDRLLEGGEDLDEFATRVRSVLAEYESAKAASVE